MTSHPAIRARIAAQMLRAAAKTAFARARRGPQRPTWSVGLEIMITMMRDGQTAQAFLPWAEQRVIGEVMGELGGKRLADVQEREASVAGLPGAWLLPDGHDEARGPVIVYLHGGSYIYGCLASHRELVMRIAKASGARVFFPIYRLAPEHPFPAAIDDAVAVVRAILDVVGPARVVLAGDSAGGGLAVATLLRLRDVRAPLPAAAALISPWVELDAHGGSLDANVDDWGHGWMFPRWAEAYLAGHDPRDPLASPAHADLRGLPPLRLDVGEAEMLHDQVVRFAARAKAHGVDTALTVWPDMVHDFQVFAATVPLAQRAIDELGAFVVEHARR
jgi:acetyl esterase/lipase